MDIFLPLYYIICERRGGKRREVHNHITLTFTSITKGKEKENEQVFEKPCHIRYPLCKAQILK